MRDTMTVKGFFERFPDEESCLIHLMKSRFGGTRLICGKCRRRGNFTLMSDRPAFACPACGHHLHPMKGTPFAFSRIPLQKWFYALYLFATSEGGVSARELQRQLGVTYKTAWRMGRKIRGDIGGGRGLENRPLSPRSAINERFGCNLLKGLHFSF